MLNFLIAYCQPVLIEDSEFQTIPAMEPFNSRVIKPGGRVCSTGSRHSGNARSQCGQKERYSHLFGGDCIVHRSFEPKTGWVVHSIIKRESKRKKGKLKIHKMREYPFQSSSLQLENLKFQQQNHQDDFLLVVSQSTMAWMASSSTQSKAFNNISNGFREIRRLSFNWLVQINHHFLPTIFSRNSRWSSTNSQWSLKSGFHLAGVRFQHPLWASGWSIVAINWIGRLSTSKLVILDDVFFHWIWTLGGC